LILTEFRPWHATALGPRDVEMGPEFAQRAQAALLGGPALTLLGDDKQILACFGIIFVGPKTAEAWAMVGDDVKANAKSIHKAAKWCLEEAHKRYEIRRLQAAISESRPTARRWAQKLGFRAESFMPKFGPDGETFIRYVRFY